MDTHLGREVIWCRLLGPSDSSMLGVSRVGVLVHIGNASEMDWTGHHVMMKRTWGDGDGEGPTDGAKCSVCRDHLCQVCHCWVGQWATKGSRAVNASHEQLSSPSGGGTNSCPHLGGSGGLNAGAPFRGRCDIVRSHPCVKTIQKKLHTKASNM